MIGHPARPIMANPYLKRGINMARTKSNQKAPEQLTMSVAEAGRLGGEKTSRTHGHAFYEEIGHKGGQRVRELVSEGKKAETGDAADRKRSRRDS